MLYNVYLVFDMYNLFTFELSHLIILRAHLYAYYLQ